MSKKPIVYIASAYTKGDPAINVHFQMKMFDELMNDGIVWPFIPLTTHFVHISFPRHYQDWINYDLALLPLFDACLRLDAVHEPLGYCISESSGADGEVNRFKEMAKPVFYNKKDLYKWAHDLKEGHPIL